MLNIYACISVVGDFILIWQQHQLYMYLVVQSLLVLTVFFSREVARVDRGAGGPALGEENDL